jgi:hypothetical protein
MLHNRLSARLIAVLCVAAGLTCITILAPTTALAQMQPQHQTLYQDIQHLQALENNAYFLELASEACIARATDAHLLTLCTDIHIDQVWQVRNARLTIKLITNVWPSNPVLSSDDQATIENLLFGPFPSLQAFVIADINAMLTKYNDSDAVSSLCANRGFYALARYYCRTLNAIDAIQANAVEDYLTFHYGNSALVHPFRPLPHH